MMITNYGNSNAIVPEVLTEDNYETWSIFMQDYLLAHDHWDIIESSSGVPDKEDDQYKTWRKKNAWALHAIRISCSPESFFGIKEADSAKSAWDLLAYRHEIGKEVDDLFRRFQEEQYETSSAEIESSLGSTSFMPLLKAIHKGNLHYVRTFLLACPEAIREVIDLDVRRTALHVAVTTGQCRIVKLLVDVMGAEELEIQDIDGNTALCLAAHKGATDIAKCLISENPHLLSIANREGKIPLVVASERGHKEITRFLYWQTLPNIIFPTGNHGVSLVVSCTMNEMFDLALDFLRRCPTPTEAAKEEYHLLRSNLLYQLSRLPYAFRSGCRLGFWQEIVYSCVSHFHQKKGVSHIISDDDVHINIYDFEDKMIDNGSGICQRICQVLGCGRLCGWRSTLLKISGIKRTCDMKFNHSHVVFILRRICQQMSDSTDRQLDKWAIYGAIEEAIKHGITEFVVEVIKAFQDLIWFSDEDVRDILISAIEYRQQEVFSLIYELYPRKDALATFTDDEDNNLLHLVAMLAPDLPQVARINGGALQMQSELRWYKEVENIVPPMFKHARNSKDETPSQTFTSQHKNLLSKGEEWMKKTANSSTVVGTLIITVAFAAAFTVPGGHNQDSGFPIFLHKAAFLIFIVADALSLFMATASVMMFVGILTSRFSEEDFLKSLPTKLIFCLSTLFISIAAMMTAFCAALVIILRGRLSVIIPIVALACFPIGFFVLFQFPLLAELTISTYGRSRSFFKE